MGFHNTHVVGSFLLCGEIISFSADCCVILDELDLELKKYLNHAKVGMSMFELLKSLGSKLGSKAHTHQIIPLFVR